MLYRINILRVICVACILFGLSACTSQPTKESGTLTVLSYADEEWFQQKYGELFSVQYPEIQLNYISTQHDTGTLDDFVHKFKQQKPDVSILTSDQFRRLMEEGLLTPLDSLVKKNKFDIQNLLPAVVQLLRDNGTLYGISPNFYSTALFYNKAIFDENQISYPKDFMTWDEVINLAQQFIGLETDLQGISQSFQSDPFHFAMTVSRLSGVRFYDPNRNVILFDQPQWRNIFEKTINGYRSKAIHGGNSQETAQNGQLSQEDILRQQNLFLVGQSAMTIDNYYFIKMLEHTESVDWDVVTVPILTREQATTNGFFISNIVAISKETSNMDLSWTLTEFINSDKTAKMLSKSSFELFARTQYNQSNEGKRIEAFYKLNPGDNMYQDDTATPPGFLAKVSEIANMELGKVIEGSADLDSAIQNIQKHSQQALSLLSVSE